jgi:hypothetical protein
VTIINNKKGIADNFQLMRTRHLLSIDYICLQIFESSARMRQAKNALINRLARAHHLAINDFIEG